MFILWFHFLVSGSDSKMLNVIYFMVVFRVTIVAFLYDLASLIIVFEFLFAAEILVYQIIIFSIHIRPFFKQLSPIQNVFVRTVPNL